MRKEKYLRGKCSEEFFENFCACGELMDMIHEYYGNRVEIYVECPVCKEKIHRATSYEFGINMP